LGRGCPAIVRLRGGVGAMTFGRAHAAERADTHVDAESGFVRPSLAESGVRAAWPSLAGAQSGAPPDEFGVVAAGAGIAVDEDGGIVAVEDDGGIDAGGVIAVVAAGGVVVGAVDGVVEGVVAGVAAPGSALSLA
jgi:hypothetical protein